MVPDRTGTAAQADADIVLWATPRHDPEPSPAQTEPPSAAPTTDPAGTTPPPTGTTDAPTGTTPPPGAPPSAPSGRHISWSAELQTIATAFYRWVARPRVRVTVIGTLLLLVGALIMANSVWTLPLVLVGALMIVTAWIGHRLDGHVSVEWGESGAEFTLRARIRGARSAPTAIAPHATSSQTPVQPTRAPARPAPANAGAAADTIEGEAHTVEIEVAELEALIAAAEHDPKAPPAATAPPATRTLRVAYGSDRASDAKR
jgi:hypothetical protein